ncbi:hypothetical protein C482_03571 [Natrialba chahannaoensis JCM 10990]|uniref:Uncharacterized protein n=1 Tax=Natrialba chahannaoensis JCM 10990 TaxID=1227492 RepID=M0AZX4_9EURY|nr:hypothetical protein [Natrialba chahannaoensis]ELZ04080.1 hypothetical protein C482_03571 [Natrialba chahannaoensis JCM 10990]
MQATIQSRTDRTVDLTVADNDGTEHSLTVTHEGELEYHRPHESSLTGDEQDLAEHERHAQLARFAKYAAFRACGFDALDPYSATDRITYPEHVAAAALVLGAMTPETVESTLETAYRQRAAVDSQDGADALPVDPPTGTSSATCRLIEQEFAIGIDEPALRPLLDVLVELEGLGALRQSMDAQPDRRSDGQFVRLKDALSQAAVTDSESISIGDTSGDIDGTDFVSPCRPIRVEWEVDGVTRVEYEDSDESAAGGDEGTVRLQLPVTDSPITSVAAFQRTVVDHLRCQLRDCYLGMGIAPPRDVQVRGPGIDSFTTTYEQGEFYQCYHDPDAIIDWTRFPPLPAL